MKKKKQNFFKNKLKVHKYIIRSVEVVILLLILIYFAGIWEQLHLNFKG